MGRIKVYIEAGLKRTFACASDWPGWCRSGPDEDAALRDLLAYGLRYAAIIRPARLGFKAPARLQELYVAERLKGNATTDFGAPGVIPQSDLEKAGAAEYARFAKVLRAGWRALDAARKRAEGKTLSKGPRGGGRELEAIMKHVVESEAGYLGAFGWKAPSADGAVDRVPASRNAILAALEASSNGEIPEKGPRGGNRWPARYFVRRVAWHAMAHAWEIERRLHSPP